MSRIYFLKENLDPLTKIKYYPSRLNKGNMTAIKDNYQTFLELILNVLLHFLNNQNWDIIPFCNPLIRVIEAVFYRNRKRVLDGYISWILGD